MSEQPKFVRLSDKILDAFQMSLKQKDIDVSELLNRALQMAMTRGAGGKEFVERREFSDAVEKALDDLDKLRSERT